MVPLLEVSLLNILYKTTKIIYWHGKQASLAGLASTIIHMDSMFFPKWTHDPIMDYKYPVHLNVVDRYLRRIGDLFYPP